MKKTNWMFGLLFFLIICGCTKRREVSAPTENVYRIAIDAKIPSLDPHSTNNVYSSLLEALFYEPLYEYHYFKRPLQITPLLAESLPEISQDNKVFKIKLKKGIHFQDNPCFESTNGKGPEVTSADVIYMFERIADKKTGSATFGTFSGKVIGFDDFHNGKAKSISGVKALDPYTVEIRLSQSSPRFAYNFATVSTALLPKECVLKLADKLATTPVGTGPFIPKQVDLGSKITAVKNPEYKTVAYPTEADANFKSLGLLEDSGKQVPFLDRVEFEIIPESQPRWLKFMAGDFEVTSVPKDNFESALPKGNLSPELEKRGVKLYRSPRADVTVQIFNMQDPVWGKKKELRQAVALAMDVERMIALQYSGQAVRAHSVIDPSQYGYEETFTSQWAKRDLKKAKELLEKAGYPDGKGLPPLNMPTLADTTSRQFDELLSKQLAEVGIVLKSEGMTWPEFERRGRDHNFTILGMGYSSTVPDVDDATSILHSKSIAVGYNMSAYKNPAVDKLIDEIETMTNGEGRMKKIREFKKIIDEDLPIIPMVHRIGNQLVQPWVKNYIYTDFLQAGTSIKYRKVIPAAKK